MIFALLLKHNGVIEHDEMPCAFLATRAPSQAFRDRTQLSSQLLRTCQKLYEDAGRVLYHENTLVVGFSVHGSYGNVHFCHMLNIHIQIPNSVSSVTKGMVDLMSCAEKLHARCQITERSYHSLSSMWPSLMRFDRLRVVVDISNHADMFISCYLARNLLENKAVVVFLPNNPSGRPNDENVVEQLMSLRWLRCRSIDVEGVSSDQIRDTVRVVTSPGCVNDFLAFL